VTDKGVVKAAGRAVMAIVKTEFGSDAGRTNAFGVALGFFLIVVLGLHAVYLETIARIFPRSSSEEFPVVAILAIFFGGLLVCVLMLVLLQAFLRRPGD
jgi:membrane-bound metal-dependent hydrolase YbcI (DUF457 family)